MARRVVAVPADGCLDPPGPRARATADERLVTPLQRPVADELLQSRIGFVAARDDEQA
ncbi:MAG TPA: hypothetical protein VLZ04_00605 [Gaiellaceae bacterium]|nr:hypothetical protein [Gaiellaceae bacterium]